MNRTPYDSGYAASKRFWPKQPASLLLKLYLEKEPEIHAALDLGCGEGTNAAFLAEHGATVTAVDSSKIAIKRAETLYRGYRSITWLCRDAMAVTVGRASLDCIMAYGLFHCLSHEGEVRELVSRGYDWLRPGGYMIVAAFNARKHCNFVAAHGDFAPLLMTHSRLCDLFEKWSLIYSSDSDLIEAHPDTKIRHLHSMTRLVAIKL